MYTNQDASTSHDGAAKTRNSSDSAFPTKRSHQFGRSPMRSVEISAERTMHTHASRVRKTTSV